MEYIELLLQPCDYAAASVIIEEAGGRICQSDGSPITLDKPCSIVAGAKKVVEEMFQTCDECRQSAERKKKGYGITRGADYYRNL